MTDHFFRDFRTAPHLHDGPLGVYVDDFAALLQEQGYSPQSARMQTRLVADLSRWLQRQGLEANDLSPQRFKSYLKYRKHHLRPNRGDASALQKLISLLRERGIVSQERCRAIKGPLELVEKACEQYLSLERGLSQATVVNYLPFDLHSLSEQRWEGRAKSN